MADRDRKAVSAPESARVARKSRPAAKPPKTPGIGKHGHKQGRPSGWNANVEARLFDTLKTGCSAKDAAEMAGIGWSTVKDRQRADPEFSARLARARTEFKVQSLAIIAKGAVKNPAWAAWWVERVYPEEFGRQRLEITGADGGPVAVEADMRVAAAIRADPEALRKISEGVALAIAARKTS